MTDGEGGRKNNTKTEQKRSLATMMGKNTRTWIAPKKK